MPSATTKAEKAIVTVPYDTATEEILSIFERDGIIILSDFASSEVIEDAVRELRLSPTKASADPITALASKSKTFTDKLLMSPKLLDIMNLQLTKKAKVWHGDDGLSVASQPQLSATVVFDSPAGSPGEPMHRHDDIFFVDHPLKQPVEVWALWAATDSTSANGAVEACVGSHTWDEEWDPSDCEFSLADMKVGSCLLLHGSTIHRVRPNTSSSLRRTIGASWCQGHYRQEENQYLNISKNTAAKLDEKVQRLIGYKINPPMQGYYELRDPLTYLQPEGQVDKTMTDFVDSLQD